MYAKITLLLPLTRSLLPEQGRVLLACAIAALLVWFAYIWRDEWPTVCWMLGLAAITLGIFTVALTWLGLGLIVVAVVGEFVTRIRRVRRARSGPRLL